MTKAKNLQYTSANLLEVKIQSDSRQLLPAKIWFLNPINYVILRFNLLPKGKETA